MAEPSVLNRTTSVIQQMKNLLRYRNNHTMQGISNVTKQKAKPNKFTATAFKIRTYKQLFTQTCTRVHAGHKIV